jgi:hypothetical protein
MKRDNFWFAFEPNRWLSNEKLALVSLGAKGLWIHLLCLAYKANEGGRLVINGITPTTEQIGRMVGEDATKLLAELETAGVFTRKDGAIYHAGIEKGLVKMNQKAEGYASRMTHRCTIDEPSMTHLSAKDEPSIGHNKSKSKSYSQSESNSNNKKEREGLRPARSDWSAYAKEIGWGTTDAESAFDYYESNGWRIGGKTPVKDWRACARNCQRRNQTTTTTKKGNQQPMNDNHRNSCYSPPTYKVMGYKCREDWVKAGCP